MPWRNNALAKVGMNLLSLCLDPSCYINRENEKRKQKSIIIFLCENVYLYLIAMHARMVVVCMHKKLKCVIAELGWDCKKSKIYYT